MKILKFEAPWCKPCMTMNEILEEFPVEIEHVNVEDEENDLVDKYKIKNRPTFVFLDDNGDVFDVIVGTSTRQEMLDIVYRKMGK